VRRARAPRRRRCRPSLLVLLALAGSLAIVGAVDGIPGVDGGSRAEALNGAEPVPRTDDSIPASRVTMIGSSPSEAANETWGVGQGSEGEAVLVRYVAGAGWSLGPGLLDETGASLSGFKLDQPTGFAAPSPLSGQITANGSGVLVGKVTPSGSTVPTREAVLVRNPGGSFKETSPVPAEAEKPGSGEGEEPAGEGEKPLLKHGFKLFAETNRAPLLAPLDESGGHAGALIVPVSTGEAEKTVLHWDGEKWSSEAIEVPESSNTEFRVVAIGASSPTNAWLLGELASGEFALFRRHREAGEAPTWQAVAPRPGAKPGEGLAVPDHEGSLEPFRIAGAPNVKSQILTVTGEGVWIDGERGDVRQSTTMFFKPQGEGSESAGVTSWCVAPFEAPACSYALPEAIPSGTLRSFAWADSGEPYGERVITGLAEGVSLRLEGTEFKRVLSLGSAPSPNDVGGTYGAAFSSPAEGWLGQFGLPVHLSTEPVTTRLTPWPTAFRHTLLAVAPEPGVPVGALSSEALAVGDIGEVARYKPGQGWLPETLLGAGGKPPKPEPVLRSVAWPTPSRAYAVGNEGAMWLWRGETGLWEQDPATPFNFRGNLLGVAFDPSNPDRGYAVGQGGVLLGYGKTWTQEALPPQVANASFTSIAFAGSEAIVAYRELPDPSRNSYVGGLLVNNGSGWEIDGGAAAVLGANVPEVAAGLPSGAAAFAASGSEAADVFERGGPGQPWQRTPVPLPGGREPGSLALFEENGAPRVVAAGTGLNTYSVESVTPSPPGFPPQLIAPYPLEASAEAGVLRQTATGWSDEEHELNNVTEPAGDFKQWDTPYQPDPVSAVLVDPTGSQGWAVGGFVSGKYPESLDTADIDRYPADGVAPNGVGSSPIATLSEDATFAIGGGAQCAAPCADRANARLGADVWLSSALARAGSIAGVRSFFYTGPHVTSGATAGPPTVAVPYPRELARYAELVAGSPIPAYVAASPSDLAGGEGESLFAQAFTGFPQPFGTALPSGSDPQAVGGQCGSSGCYYAVDSAGSAGTVRVIVLDDSSDVGAAQRTWLAEALIAAKALKRPAIVIGNADLNTQISTGDPQAIAVASVLQADGASAYFFDAPEENIQEPLIGAAAVPSFGSGTLGYVNFIGESKGDFLGASGFLLAQVNFKSYNAATNRAAVTARLIPSIGELALEAKEGTLLHRSEVAQFAALARRVRAGNRAPNDSAQVETDPYIPIPSNCYGTACAHGLLPEYKFTSSKPDIGNFVTPNLASTSQPAVLQNAKGEPIPDEQSGLFCAYNPGTTIVTISAGGLSFSLPVTVQAGSVREPCGTVPLSELPAQQSGGVTPPPAPAPAPAGPAPAQATPAPVPVPPVPAAVAAAPVIHPAPAAKPLTFLVPPALQAPVLAFVPPPVPTPARPTPPSGTSAVTSPVEAAEKEEEHEEATEQVSNQAVTYRSSEHDYTPEALLGLMVLAAFAGVSIRRRPRRRRGEAQVAAATVTTLKTQRRMRRDDPWN
jgi:hypothetical protein